MPLKRLSHISILNQVNFMKSLGSSILVIDNLNSAYIIVDCAITNQR